MVASLTDILTRIGEKGSVFQNTFRAPERTMDLLYRRTQVKESGGSNIASWQFFGPARPAEVRLDTSGLIATWMNNARTNSAVQSPNTGNPAWGDQASDRLGYDGSGRTIAKRYLAGGLNTGTPPGYSNATPVVGFTTALDRAGNKLYERHLHAPSRSHLYEPLDANGNAEGGYDSLDRLLQYQRGTLASGGGSISSAITLSGTDALRTYELDGLGNWRRTGFTQVSGSPQTEVRQHNGLNQITRTQNGATQTNLSYDGAAGASNGNLKNEGTRTYAWDALNRLVQVNRVSDGAVIGQYVYDALSRRIRRVVSNGGLSGDIPNGTTDFLYAGQQCVEERDGSNTPTMQYVWGIYVDEIIQQNLLVGLNGFSAGVFYPLQDLLYRTTGLADAGGTVREACDTDAYGNTLIFRNAGSPPGQINFSTDTPVDYPTCPFIFTGQRFDPETGLYFYRARYFHAALGRFISKDPISYAGGMNLYRYATDNPLTHTDPTGLSCWTDCMTKMHKLYYDRTVKCLEVCGVGAAVGLEACLIKCIFSGPGYPACVSACFTAVGIGAGVAGACCAIYYTTSMLGASIGCTWGCW